MSNNNVQSSASVSGGVAPPWQTSSSHGIQQRQQQQQQFLLQHLLQLQRQQQPQQPQPMEAASRNIGNCFFNLNPFGHHGHGGHHRAANPMVTNSSNDMMHLHAIRNDENSKEDLKTMDDADLAKELNDLSATEREKVMNDVHGVAEVPNIETAEFVQSSFEKLDKALEEYPKSAANPSRKAYDQAKFLKPTLVDSRTEYKFKLLFLRMDQYDPIRTAKRLLRYFEDKLRLFGVEKLAKTCITLDDLSDEDRRVFDNGYFLRLPHKDAAGRPIWSFDYSKIDFVNIQSTVRISVVLS